LRPTTGLREQFQPVLLAIPAIRYHPALTKTPTGLEVTFIWLPVGAGLAMLSLFLGKQVETNAPDCAGFGPHLTLGNPPNVRRHLRVHASPTCGPRVRGWHFAGLLELGKMPGDISIRIAIRGGCASCC